VKKKKEPKRGGGGERITSPDEEKKKERKNYYCISRGKKERGKSTFTGKGKSKPAALGRKKRVRLKRKRNGRRVNCLYLGEEVAERKRNSKDLSKSQKTGPSLERKANLS